MMIQSMTAFARSEAQGKWGSAVCELRSINHRYLELSLRLPERLHALESSLRERIREYVKRGKVECYLRFQSSDANHAEINVNTELANQLCRANEKIAQYTKNPAPLDTLKILLSPGVLQIAEVDIELIQTEILKVLEEALQQLVKARTREGEELKKIFFQRLNNMKEEITKVKLLMPTILEQQREKLILRFKEAKLELDPTRLESEMVMFAQKIDVTEELDRLDVHIAEVEHALKHGGLIGRRLDFLMQELNREANTLGSKSVNLETTRVSVELKVLIEQIREQVQNIE